MTKDEIIGLAQQSGLNSSEEHGNYEHFANLIEQSVIKRLSAGAGEPAAWITMWPSPEGGYKPVLHPHSDRPKYGTPLDESLGIFPLYTEPQVTAPLSGFKLLEITVAYEQGVGKGMKRDNFNPYKPGCDAARAWQLGYEEGEKKSSAPAPLSDSDIEEIVGFPNEGVAANHYYRICRAIERHVKGEK